MLGADPRHASSSNVSPRPPQLDAHPVPLVWQGFQSWMPPQHLDTLTTDELRRFLQQAGRPADQTAGREALLTAAHTARSAWEVERIVVGCGMPEDVLRVARGCVDPVALKAAWRKVAMAVHPDKCHADGAADAMAIAHDAYEMLALRAGPAAASDAGTGTVAATVSGRPTAERAPSSTGSEADLPTVAAVPPAGAAVPEGVPVGAPVERRDPVKVRVRLKAVKSEPCLVDKV